MGRRHFYSFLFFQMLIFCYKAIKDDTINSNFPLEKFKNDIGYCYFLIVVGLIMIRNKSIDSEYYRLKNLFKSLEQDKSILVDNLIQQAAFIKVELEKLQNLILKYGTVEVTSTGEQRQTEAAKYYIKLVSSYSAVIKTLNTILSKAVDEVEALDLLIE